MLDHAGKEPLYIQLANELRTQIDTKVIKPGEKLKSESEMVAEYQVGRLTVRNALDLLLHEGLIEKVQGRGTFCRRTAASETYLNIEVLLDMGNTYFIPTYYVRGLSEVFAANNCNLLINDTCADTGVLCSQLERIAEKGADGVVFQLTQADVPAHLMSRLNDALDGLKTQQIPLIMLDSKLEREDISYVCLDEQAGGGRAAEHFAAFQHKKTAVLYNPAFWDSRERYLGFCKAAEMFRLDPPVAIDLSSNWMKAVLSAYAGGVTGFFGYNDEAAAKCLRLLNSNQISVPEQVSVIGFDDSYLAAATAPPLAVLSHPKDLMTRHAAQNLLYLIRNGSAKPVRETFHSDLIHRESCSFAPK